jgi:hydrogenase maturation protein HypF
VYIEVQGPPDRVAAFSQALGGRAGGPPLARIDRVTTAAIAVLPHEEGFAVWHSDTSGEPAASVTPDAAVCRQCLAEMRDKSNFRFQYPFINCTNCGPRYTIVKAVPYDRPNTTMSVFSMCGRCEQEYHNAADRRFHAQPIACPACGPHLWLLDASGRPVAEGDAAVCRLAREMLLAGKILAIKGIGGFHLGVDATSEEAVRLLRIRKRREHKPFAMMAGSMDAVRQCAAVPPFAESILASPQSPIVLMPKKHGIPVAPSVACGVNTYGLMLPYAPLHHILFDRPEGQRGLEALVMTSANLADQPLIHRNDEAVKKLAGIADAFVVHDRDIYRPLDDSVVHFVDGVPVPLRRSRGYVPAVVRLPAVSCRTILAGGSDLKNTFCLVRGDQCIVSEHIGDLEDADVYRHYRRSVSHVSGLYGFRPAVVAADLHPGYHSRQFVRSFEQTECVEVQHHWAHIASVLAEHGQTGPVIGIAADGTGYGTDGAIWGCECLIASLEQFSRFGHLRYFPLAGGDKASRQAIRPLIALLDQSFGGLNAGQHARILEAVEPDAAARTLILQQIRRGINTAATSSLGRVFDAVAAMAGLGSVNHFEAQLPMALEAEADSRSQEKYPFGIVGQPAIIDLAPMFRAIVSDLERGEAASVVSERFHNTIAAALVAMARLAGEVSGLKTVALSGGVFCNRLLAERTIGLLRENGFSVLYNTIVPANDGGLSLGQAAIAAWRYRE